MTILRSTVLSLVLAAAALAALPSVAEADVAPHCGRCDLGRRTTGSGRANATAWAIGGGAMLFLLRRRAQRHH